MKRSKLPCGCIPEESDCPEAEKLWKEVDYRHNLLKKQPCFERWKDYNEALYVYRTHKS